MNARRQISYLVFTDIKSQKKNFDNKSEKYFLEFFGIFQYFANFTNIYQKQ